jgi:hypothetical protein
MIFDIFRLGLCVFILSGCATIDVPIGIPPRPDLIPLSAELQEQIPPDILDIIAVNDASLKNHIKRLESRIRLHDDSL